VKNRGGCENNTLLAPKSCRRRLNRGFIKILPRKVKRTGEANGSGKSKSRGGHTFRCRVVFSTALRKITARGGVVKIAEGAQKPNDGAGRGIFSLAIGGI